MIYDTYEPYPNDTISELWAECISGQNIGNFIITMCTILGLYQSDVTHEDQYLRAKYSALKYTRMELNKGNGQLSSFRNECTFKPQISDRSKKIATSQSKEKRARVEDRPLTDRYSKESNNSVVHFEKSKMSIDDEDN